MLNREDIFLLFSACTITEIDSAECIHKRSISSWTDFTYFLICLTIIFPKKSFLASPYDGEKCNTKCYHLPVAHFRPILLVHSWAHQSYVCKYHLRFREKVRIHWNGWKGSLRIRRHYAPISFEISLECTQVNILLALIVSGTFFSHFVYNRASSVISFRSQSIHTFGHFYFLLFMSSTSYLKRRGVGQRSKTGKLAITICFS